MNSSALRAEPFLGSNDVRDLDRDTLSHALMTIPVPAMIVDQQGTVVLCNRRARSVVWPDFRGKPDDEFQPNLCAAIGCAPDELEDTLRRGIASGQIVVSKPGYPIGRNDKDLLFRVSLLRSRPDLSALILIVVDPVMSVMNTLTKAKDENRLIAAQLQTSLQLSEKLQDALSSAVAFSRAASHDLQTPLNAVRGLLEMLGDRHGDEFSDDAQVYLDLAMRAVAKMESLTCDLLGYSAHSFGHGTASVVRVREVLDEAIGDLSQKLEDHGATVNVSGSDYELRADPTLLGLVFSNLLDNALKYRHPERPLEIDISLEIELEQVGHINIRDNGLGFSSGDAERLFEPFVRLPHHKGMEGNGIGLSTCRQICQRMGWKIDAQGLPSAGAQFHIEFPQLLV